MAENISPTEIDDIKQQTECLSEEAVLEICEKQTTEDEKKTIPEKEKDTLKENLPIAQQILEQSLNKRLSVDTVFITEATGKDDNSLHTYGEWKSATIKVGEYNNDQGETVTKYILVQFKEKEATYEENDDEDICSNEPGQIEALTDQTNTDRAYSPAYKSQETALDYDSSIENDAAQQVTYNEQEEDIYRDNQSEILLPPQIDNDIQDDISYTEESIPELSEQFLSDDSREMKWVDLSDLNITQANEISTFSLPESNITDIPRKEIIKREEQAHIVQQDTLKYGVPVNKQELQKYKKENLRAENIKVEKKKQNVSPIEITVTPNHQPEKPMRTEASLHSEKTIHAIDKELSQTIYYISEMKPTTPKQEMNIVLTDCKKPGIFVGKEEVSIFCPLKTQAEIVSQLQALPKNEKLYIPGERDFEGKALDVTIIEKTENGYVYEFVELPETRKEEIRKKELIVKEQEEEKMVTEQPIALRLNDVEKSTNKRRKTKAQEAKEEFIEELTEEEIKSIEINITKNSQPLLSKRKTPPKTPISHNSSLMHTAA